MRTSVQLVLGILFLLAFETFKLGLSNAPWSVGRKLVAVTLRGAALVTTVSGTGRDGMSSQLSIHMTISQWLTPYIAKTTPHCETHGWYDWSEVEMFRHPSFAASFVNRLWAGFAPESAIRSYTAGGVGSFWVYPNSPPDEEDGASAAASPREPALIVHLHSGGFVHDDESAFAYRLARRTGYRVLVLAYPLAPEYSSSQQRGALVAEILSSLHDQDPQRRILLSAARFGATVGAEALLALRDKRAGGVVSAVALVSPVVAGHSTRSEDHQLRCALSMVNSTLLERDKVSWEGLPPVYVQVSAGERMEEHVSSFYKRISNEKTHLEVVPNSPEAVALYSDLVGSEATAALNNLGDWLRDQVKKLNDELLQ
jgi:acetyl esterase/lipase